ncbi:MAG: UrcA family protein [Pseudomonadota bacterium]
MRNAILGALLATGLGNSLPVSAQSAEAAAKALNLNPRFIRTVDLSNFDLNTLDGISRAHRRIVSTAYQVCSPILSTVASDQRQYRACIAESVDEAIGRAEQANLTSFHLALPEGQRAHIWKAAPSDWQPASG